MSSTVKDTTAADLLVDNTAQKNNLAGYAQKSLTLNLIIVVAEEIEYEAAAEVTVEAGGEYVISENDGGGVAPAVGAEMGFSDMGD